MAEAKDMYSFEKPGSTLAMAEDVMGCKWSLSVLGVVRQGICRPGMIQRSIEGLTTKVMNERLKKLTRYNIIERQAYPEIPPRVEYHLTDFGKKFVSILDQFSALDQELETRAKS